MFVNWALYFLIVKSVGVSLDDVPLRLFYQVDIVLAVGTPCAHALSIATHSLGKALAV